MIKDFFYCVSSMRHDDKGIIHISHAHLGFNLGNCGTFFSVIFMHMLLRSEIEVNPLLLLLVHKNLPEGRERGSNTDSC